MELLDGQIVERSPINPPHAACVTRLTHLFNPLAGGRATLRIQHSLVVANDPERQPDVVLVRYPGDGYKTGHSRAPDAFLVIEVADRTWLVNLPWEEIERAR